MTNSKQTNNGLRVAKQSILIHRLLPNQTIYYAFKKCICAMPTTGTTLQESHTSTNIVNISKLVRFIAITKSYYVVGLKSKNLRVTCFSALNTSISLYNIRTQFCKECCCIIIKSCLLLSRKDVVYCVSIKTRPYLDFSTFNNSSNS